MKPPFVKWVFHVEQGGFVTRPIEFAYAAFACRLLLNSASAASRVSWIRTPSGIRNRAIVVSYIRRQTT